MTCLVALRHRRGIILASDSAMSDGSSLVHGPKIDRRGSVWIATAGDAGRSEAMLAAIPRGAKPRYLGAWLQRKPLCDQGIAVCGEQIVEWAEGGVCPILDYTAAGSGWLPALGALHALRGLRASPTAAVLGALRASAAHCPDVAGPFEIVDLPSGRRKWYR